MDGVITNARQLEVYEIGAWLLTRLAFPGKQESQEQLSRVHASLCAYALRTKYETDGEWLVSPQPIKPIYALRPQFDIDRDLKTLQRRLRDRMIAARMAIGFLKEAVTGEIPQIPGLERMSINQMALLVLKDTRYTDPENVESRIWRPSLPVIHLATAIQLMLQLAEPYAGPLGLESLLLGRLKIAPEKLMRIRLI